MGIALLVPAAPATAQAPDATVNVDLRWDGIFIWGFEPGSNVTVKVFNGITETFSESKPTDGDGAADFDAAAAGVDLVAGMNVQAFQGGDDCGSATTCKKLTIHDLVIDRVNPLDDKVTGSVSASEGTSVFVGVSDHISLEDNQEVFVSATGTWEATFTAFDIDWPHGAHAQINDADGDSTGVSKEPPRIEAFPQWSGISGRGFLAGATVTFSVMDGGVEQIPTNNTGTADAYGNVEFNLPEDCCGGFDAFPKLRPGMVVSASDGTTSKSVVVSNLSIDRVDLELNRVTGSADPGQSVAIELHDPTIEVPPSVVVADSTSRWQVDFTDITTSSSISAKILDAERDATGRDFNPPQIQASQDPNWWGGLQLGIGQFNPGTLMTLTIIGPGGGTLLSNTYTLEDGNFERNFGNLDALPGMVIRATDGVYTKELAISEPLTIDVIDPLNDEVRGTAPLGSVVSIGAAGQSLEVPADAPTTDSDIGGWTAAFTDTDIDIDDDGFASISDDDGDSLNAEKSHRIVTVDASRGRIFADQFAANSWITFKVFDSGGLEKDSGSVESDATGRAVFTSSVSLVGGMEVVVTDAYGERRGVLPDITIGSVDPTFDTAWGTADSTVTFTAGSLCGLTESDVTRNDSAWSLDGYVFDIIHTVQVCGPSPAQAGFDPRSSLSAPVLTVDPIEDLITADGFDPAAGNITFEIYAAPEDSTPLESASVAPEDFTNENGVTFPGHAEYPRATHGRDLVAGMFVKATQNTTPTATVKKHEIAPLSVDVADPVTSDVSGTAQVPTDGELIVALDLQFVLRPEVDVDGNWEITKSDRTFDCGEVEPCVWQLEHEAVINASVVDTDGDRTLVLQGAAEEVTCSAATSCTTDNESPADGSTELDPVETTVTSPNSGTIRIAEEQLTRQAPDTFAFLGQQVDIDAPTATAENPLQIMLRLDATRIPKGKTATDLQIYRNGEYVLDCAADSGGTASPDPCVSAREKLSDGDAQLTVRSSQASDWNAGASTDARAPTLDSASFSVNPKTRSQQTVLTATASDALSGVGGGEFFIGADPGQGQGSQMLLSGSTLEGTIGTLDPGTYDVGVRARDKAGNWSGVTTLTLDVESDPSGGGGGGGGTASPAPSSSPSPSPSPSPSESVSPEPSPSEPVSPGPSPSGPDETPIDPSCDQPEVTCGTDGDDVLIGTEGPDVILGGAGDDTITGSDGDDLCVGGGGDDTIDCGEGTDVIRGGAGNDDLRSTLGDDLIRGGSGKDSISGGAGIDVLRGGSGADVLRGGAGGDRLFGGGGNDLLVGSRGHDTIVGGIGSDVMRGRKGRDTFKARDGYADRINGGPGRDIARVDELDSVFSAR